MEDKLKKVESILKEFNQEHVIQFYDELDDNQKENLLNQILSIDFDEISTLYNESKQNSIISTEEIEPLEYYIKENLTQED